MPIIYLLCFGGKDFGSDCKGLPYCLTITLFIGAFIAGLAKFEGGESKIILTYELGHDKKGGFYPVQIKHLSEYM